MNYFLTVLTFFENNVYLKGLEDVKKDFGRDLFSHRILHPLLILPISVNNPKDSCKLTTHFHAILL
mgnify:CR=1 FL=1